MINGKKILIVFNGTPGELGVAIPRGHWINFFKTDPGPVKTLTSKVIATPYSAQIYYIN